MDDRPSWSKIAILGVVPHAMACAFRCLVGADENVGRIVMDGDALEFAVLRNPDDGCALLVVELLTPPFNEAQVLEVVGFGATQIVFAAGEASEELWSSYLANVQGLTSASIELVAWHEERGLPSAPLERACLAAADRLIGRTRIPDPTGLGAQKILLPPAIPTGLMKVDGYMADGQPIRPDVALRRNRR